MVGHKSGWRFVQLAYAPLYDLESKGRMVVNGRCKIQRPPRLLRDQISRIRNRNVKQMINNRLNIHRYKVIRIGLVFLAQYEDSPLIQNERNFYRRSNQKRFKITGK